MKHIHFIGICGVAMSALALALKRAGHEKLPDGSLVPSYEVTGSDVGIYPPISTYLKESGVNYYVGWHPDLMTQNGDPDLVVVGNVASSNNPEWLYVQEHKLNYKSYPEVIKEFFIKENSIVCAGTYGKTTSSALLTWILKENNFDPSYMFGGISLNDIPAAEITNSKYSVVEGDEYKSARWDNGPKFSHYSPTHLLLTAVVWDHADVYPTEESYFNAFENLVRSMPKKGLIVACADNKNISYLLSPITKNGDKRYEIKTYGNSENVNYKFFDIIQTQDGLNFKIINNSTIYNLQSSIFGSFNAENITGCFAMAHQLGIEPENIIKAIASFKNIKRRLEKRYSNGVTIFDDIAHSPKKAEAVLASLKKIYNGKIICIFEPNGGNRQEESIPGYNNAFTNADEVIIPHLTTIKQDPTKPQVMDGQKLTDIISKTHNNVKYIDDDNDLINYLIDNTNDGDVIVFCGSHGFRGMIDLLISRLTRIATQN